MQMRDFDAEKASEEAFRARSLNRHTFTTLLAHCGASVQNIVVTMRWAAPTGAKYYGTVSVLFKKNIEFESR